MNDTTQVVERSQGAVTKGQEEKSLPTMTLLPAVDIVEDSNGVTLWADLPGVTKDKLEVNVHDGNLHIEAEAVVPTPKGLRVQHAEIREPHFARAFSLSADLDTSRIEANLHDGVLKLTIPRREEARPRRIAVTVA
ncbi:Hsp20/alpha crystallin family protein [Cupriavidus taiwanensis]|uniref:Small heat shock protein (HSP20) family protein n=2 Tax=Cupriavidus taiwanensis TaxID=164546 RepID=B3RCY4_CUPTR|nr:Hsp20/alpha crystallin family protein [Cupriavidus taiwanensis]CAQ72759.1 putative small heat shock protein (HSP20) family protein [Cupriavidus taiwanensis LMG 19424]SOY64914.1 putative small heat shock protein (HSP20) family protein [Cupriavidus taiwanensis]SOZ09009.1 putative small heat shock protein (HSP20) family protein [Cupriavidus taiwanensis]SOZ11256.1 putative small heat shock protein (HSP20) family protein [Cupriavidus taiwanensis]SOZ42608.1 putative small heat shock protein (HSP2